MSRSIDGVPIYHTFSAEQREKLEYRLRSIAMDESGNPVDADLRERIAAKLMEQCGNTESLALLRACTRVIVENTFDGLVRLKCIIDL